MKILLTGASGMVVSYLADRFSILYDLLTPTHAELNILDCASVMEYFKKHRPDVVIHAAGVTDPKKAEAERGDEGGLCFQTNVLGTQYITEASRRVGAFLIHISTGSVFLGDEKNPGPFSESARLPTELGRMSWYGWTKVLAEREVGKYGAIVRLSKPLHTISFNPKNSFARPGLAKLKNGTPRVKFDYLGKLLDEYKNHTLAGLMTDQFFPVVSMDEIVQLLCWIIEHKSPGVYHAASPDVVSPLELLSYKVIELSRNIPTLAITFEEFIKTQELALRHQQYSAIDSRGTVEKTGIQFMGWREVVSVAFVSSPT